MITIWFRTLWSRLTRSIVLAGVVLWVAGCSLGLGARPLSAQQVQQFVADQQIQPLVVQEVDGLMTAIVFRKADNVGCVLLWDGRNGIGADLTSTATDGVFGNRAAKPVTIIDLYGFHNEVLCITINDAQLRQHAQTLSVRFPNGETITVPVQQQEAVILAHKKELDTPTLIVDITIYDSDQQIIYQARE